METKASQPISPQPATTFTSDHYRVWACDNQVYGPVSFETLLEWVADGRVLRRTWLYRNASEQWQMADKFPELHEHFLAVGAASIQPSSAMDASSVTLSELRQFQILSPLSSDQLKRLVTFAHLELAEPNHLIISKSSPGDCFYFILAGSVRARIKVGGEERTLAYISAGQFFGDLAMLTQTPRSADVIAMEHCKLLGINAEAFRRLVEQDTETAAPLLLRIAQDLARHILEDNVRFQRELASGFVWR